MRQNEVKLLEPGKLTVIHCPEQKNQKYPKPLHVWFSSHLDWEFSQYQEESRH